MCCNKRRQQRLLQQQELLQFGSPVASHQRGCCGSRRQQRLIREVETYGTHSYLSPEITQTQQQSIFPLAHRKPCGSMAGMLVIGVAMGAEKLGRKISEKRLERKEKKTTEQREAIYGHAESSFAGAVQNQLDIRPERQSRKREEARQEQSGGKRRRSVSSERTLLLEDPPPSYEEVVRQEQRRA